MREVTYLDTLRKRQRPRELAIPALADGIALLVALAGDGGLARDGQDIVLDVDLDVLLRQPGQLERGRHKVLVLVLMEVQPVAPESASSSKVEVRNERTYLGRSGRAAVLLPSRVVRADEPCERALNASSKRLSKSARE